MDRDEFIKEILSEMKKANEISLRDYFAAASMASIPHNSFPHNSFDYEANAKWCFDMADAMLQERNGG